MHRLITRCISKDYKTATDDHTDDDRGELDLDTLGEVLFDVSYAMPHSSDPESPHRPSIGFTLPENRQATFFYASDYQGTFSLQADGIGQFNVDDILALLAGQTTIEDIQAQKAASDKRMGLGIKVVLGAILLGLISLIAITMIK